MAKYNERKIPYDEQNELLDHFCAILAGLGTKDKIYKLLKDIFNRKERMTTIRRLRIAIRIYDGKTYDEIKDELKCGKTTIARVQRWLNFGRDGIKEAIRISKRLKNKSF